MKEALMRKIAGVPAAVWLAGFAGALYLYRRLSASSGGGTSGASSTDVGSNLPLFPTSAGGGAGAGVDQALPPDQPTPQQFADPNLDGSGAPVVFDPATAGYPTDGGSGDFAPSPLPIVSLAGGYVYDPNTDTVYAPGGGGGRSAVVPTTRPKTTKGTKSKKARPRTATKKPAAHPASRAHTTKPAPARHQVTAKKTVAPARSASSTPAATRSVTLISDNSPAAQPKPQAKPVTVSGGVGTSRMV